MVKKLTTNDRIKQKKPIETWQSLDGTWIWNVYRKYQKPKNEAENEYARWFVGVTSPMTYGSEELGDDYCHQIMKYAVLVYKEEPLIAI